MRSQTISGQNMIVLLSPDEGITAVYSTKHTNAGGYIYTAVYIPRVYTAVYTCRARLGTRKLGQSPDEKGIHETDTQNTVFVPS